MLLAANHGNKYSIAIEVNSRLPFLRVEPRFTQVASSPLVDHDLWEEFKEAIADNWGNYRYQRSVILCFRACKAL